MRRKLLLIGIDGAPFDLVRSWAAEGHLPQIKQLIETGAFGVLESPLDVTPPAWSSIYTGKNPGKHGVFDFMVRQDGGYSFSPTNSTRRDGRDFWEILGDHGIRVGILNAPLTYPPRKVNGVLVTGFLTPGENVGYTYPEGLQAELKKNIPGFRHSSADELQLNLRREKYVQGIYEKVENLGKAALYLMKDGEFDFFFLAISETDHVQHWFWEDMESGQGSKYRDVILNTYKMADRVVGDLVSEKDPEMYVMIASDHGGARLRRFFHTNHFLHSIGLLNFKSSLRTQIRRTLYSVGLTQRLYESLLRSNLYWLRYALQPLTLSIGDIDWDRTGAYAFGYGQIYVNRKGRENHGTVGDEEYESVRSTIVGRLLEAVDPETHVRPVAKVSRKEEAFAGAHLGEAPDIQFLLKEGYEPFPWATIADRTFSGNIDRSGTHNTRGLVILKGPGVKQGEMTGSTVLDIAPTILNIMGAEVPVDMDGKVMTQALTDEFRERNPVTLAAPELADQQKRAELSAAEQEIIEQNLRALGYV